MRSPAKYDTGTRRPSVSVPVRGATGPLARGPSRAAKGRIHLRPDHCWVCWMSGVPLWYAVEVLLLRTRGIRMVSLPLGVTPRQGVLALAAGLLGAAAFWPLSLWPLLLISIAFFLRLLRDLDVQASRNVGMVYGLAFAGGTMYWLFRVF